MARHPHCLSPWKRLGRRGHRGHAVHGTRRENGGKEPQWLGKRLRPALPGFEPDDDLGPEANEPGELVHFEPTRLAQPTEDAPR